MFTIASKSKPDVLEKFLPEVLLGPELAFPE